MLLTMPFRCGTDVFSLESRVTCMCFICTYQNHKTKQHLRTLFGSLLHDVVLACRNGTITICAGTNRNTEVSKIYGSPLTSYGNLTFLCTTGNKFSDMPMLMTSFWFLFRCVVVFIYTFIFFSWNTAIILQLACFTLYRNVQWLY